MLRVNWEWSRASGGDVKKCVALSPPVTLSAADVDFAKPLLMARNGQVGKCSGPTIGSCRPNRVVYRAVRAGPVLRSRYIRPLFVVHRSCWFLFGQCITWSMYRVCFIHLARVVVFVGFTVYCAPSWSLRRGSQWWCRLISIGKHSVTSRWTILCPSLNIDRNVLTCYLVGESAKSYWRIRVQIGVVCAVSAPWESVNCRAVCECLSVVPIFNVRWRRDDLRRGFAAGGFVVAERFDPWISSRSPASANQKPL